MGRLWTLFSAVVLLCVAYTLFSNYTLQPGCPSPVQVVHDPVQPTLISLPLVLEEHKYHAHGLLETVAAGRHPIYDLIARAEKEWEAKQRSASRTLQEAVTEYKRRYGRQPPQGFDKWWEYVQRHDVQLPDEYDQIYRDLEPYWGMDPTDLRELYTRLENEKSNFMILTKEDGGNLDLVNLLSNPDRQEGPAWSAIELLANVQEHLPPFRAIFTHDDRPNRLTDFNMKESLLEAAKTQSLLRKKDLIIPHYRRWRSACDPDSHASTITFDLDAPAPSKPSKSFIHDHRLAMDPCLHPELWWTHGQFVSHDTGPGAQPAMIPEFAYCSTTLHHDIRVPSLYGWVDGVSSSEDPVWNDKIEERMVWRGLNTGITYSESSRWNMSHRTTLLAKTSAIAGNIDVLPLTQPDQQVGLPVPMKNAFLSPALFDVGIAGKYTCSGSVCAYLEEHFPPKNRHNGKDTWRYKYILDIDGNGWSGRFQRLMSSNSLVFKSTIYPDWYVDRVQPWVHYVPVQVDLSDLHDTLMFFRGGLDGKDGHDELAQKIAYTGKRWTQNYWRKEDMTAYLFRLFLEYGRVMSEDRLMMSYSDSY